MVSDSGTDVNYAELFRLYHSELRTYSDELAGARAEVRELRVELQRQKSKIVGWENFNKYKDDMVGELGVIGDRLDAVEISCVEIKTERSHMATDRELASLEQKMLCEFTDLKTTIAAKNAVSDWSWCWIKKVASAFPFRAVYVGLLSCVGVFLGASIAPPWIGRQFEAGEIARDQIIPSTYSLVIQIFLFVFVLGLLPLLYISLKKVEKK